MQLREYMSRPADASHRGARPSADTSTRRSTSSAPWASAAGGEELDPVGVHTIACSNRAESLPSRVTAVHPSGHVIVPRALIDHWLDREDVPGFIVPIACSSVVRHVRRTVE